MLIPLRFNIATMVSVIVVLVAGAIVYYDQSTGRRAALADATVSFEKLGGTVRLELEALTGPVEAAVAGLTATVSLLPADSMLAMDTVRLFAQRISETDNMFALNWADQQGNNLLVNSLRGNEEVVSSLVASLGAQTEPAYLVWLIERPTPGDYEQTVLHLDPEYRIDSADPNQNIGYDPRVSPWFRAAMDSDGIVATPPYIFFTRRDMGFSLSSRTADGKGVIAGHVFLENVSEALDTGRATESSLTVLFDDTTAIIAAADIDHVLDVRRPNERPVVTQYTLASTGIPSYRALSRLYASGEREGVFEVEADGQQWVVGISELSLGGGRHVNMGVLAPSDEVFADVNKRLRVSLVVAVFGVGVGLVVAWLFAQAISRPIRILTNEAFQMRTFDLSDRPPVKSRIVEVERLSQAVQTLKRAMADFGRYVPAQLVRRLVAGEMTSEIGGERREVTLLFTDIADFTSISEDMDPSTLMQEVSEYLAEASRTLIENGATIDKYIGDAIMAMWNAPVDQDNHVELACRAALETAKVIDSLNERRLAEGKWPFHTRFGLHVGEAVVGNVGSAERINYTALGGSVNLASRLEGLNKQLGTQILVSDAVMGALPEEFVTRPVDMVRPKGTSHPVRVFELMNPGHYALEENTNAHLESWRVCYISYTERRWADAVADIERHMQHFPSDTAAEVLRARAAGYRSSPPPEDWDGVFEAQTK